ncbi:MAG: helix-turn-helix domain-containing protein [Spirochaetaceae bacterium]|jgi:transcriptional regulator with XRE-family HTH domain|nr:helix-turn-helix domain-containing protein [Spirochaetaceae bacterium]
MTSLKKLIANNIKEQRRILGISQAALAERVDTSTHYIAMIELERKTPSLPMLERIAVALQIDPPELFSMRSIPTKSLKEMQKAVLSDIEKAVNQVIYQYLKAIEDSTEKPTEYPDKQ